MANIRVVQSPYIGPFANIEQVNESYSATASPYGVGIHVGELGARVELTQAGTGTKEYQKVQLDSGTAVSYAAGQLLYWKDKSKYLVTADAAQAIGAQSVASTNNGFRNEVAGVLTVTTPTAGNYTWIQQKGQNTIVKITSGSPNPGDVLVGSTTANSGTIVAAGTAPTVQGYGKFSLSQTSVTAATVDLDIPGIP